MRAWRLFEQPQTPAGDSSMGWTYLIVAGLFEVGFTSCLKLSDGFTRTLPSIGFFVFASVSFALLTKAVVTIPLGTAYAVWTGIGACGTAIVGMVFFGDPVSGLRVLLLATIVAAIAGLKYVAG